MQVRDPAAIRRWRKQRRYTQRELAMLVRRSHTTIYALETGRLQNITEDLAIAIAARLDVPWEDLFIAHEVELVREASNVSHDERRLTA
ncbi:helix-turn-helix transcriptional regulator [Nocardia africana]|uniref:Helix-turn-helix n=2 Tax=Nocardia africana TaxID=134964 RepID=A0A378X3N1_9NOCA|nr:helix-turn-helix transcriptional regulator [Nocardia africana]MCC3311479.1 helix-turn-helix domain-containing protein [Nocardia africana]SUA47261.1 Helix-turn-helix [Nocardia africana]